MDQVKRCPYCAEEILAAAIKCKHCGSDLASAQSEAASPRELPPTNPVITIQRTSKSIKKAQIALGALLFISIFMLVGSNPFGPLLFWVSIIGLIITRFARWWANE